MEREWPFLHGVRSILGKAVALPIPHTVAQGHTVASGPTPWGKFWNKSKHTYGWSFLARETWAATLGSHEELSTNGHSLD